MRYGIIEQITSDFQNVLNSIPGRVVKSMEIYHYIYTIIQSIHSFDMNQIEIVKYHQPFVKII